MRNHVDWLSFTMQHVTWDSTPDDPYGESLGEEMFRTLGAAFIEKAMSGVWELRERSRAPYKHSWEIKGVGITVFASPTLPHFLIEISGAGCERIIELGEMEHLLRATQDRVTRIDIACDIETDTKPQDFVNVLTSKRMRASGYQTSESGTTCYVGSRTSERFARVYRYNAPHPRAHLLRVEHEFKREYAKSVVLGILRDGIGSVAQASGMAFGWGHRDWDVGVDTSSDISIVSSERAFGKTLFWLVDTCAPSFKRLVKEGIIKDPEAFIMRYFLSDD